MQSSSKEVSLQTRVKDLKGLCNSLMILPKEIKSLKARIYKLETIINDKVESVGKQYDLGDKCWSDQDVDFFTYIGLPNQTSNKDSVNDLIDAFDDLVDAVIDFYYFQWFGLCVIATCVLTCQVDKDLSQDDCVKAKKQEAEKRILGLQLILEEENSMKSIDRSNSTRMKLALDKCGTTKRSSGWRHCKFPWCNDVVMDRPFWDSLIGLDDNRLDEIYPLAWMDVEQVFILINEPNRHWSLAQFHIKSRNVTFYDSQETFDVEIRPWYVKIMRCLESKLPVILQETGIWLDHEITLHVEDPIQTALAYQEKMINFFFDHKIIIPS
uniref:Phospholipase-like protein n=1 Tax=Tanacetum cinerariifolium TaxID=118510 RepID=A0A6L2NWK3_TANCI|nr:hypothetical protein [Tanacetum cinerariifolium]